MLRKIALLFILLTIPLRVNASDEKGWYPFLQTKGWYPFEGGGSSSASSSGDKDQPLVQPTAQPTTGSTQSPANTQSSNQPGQSNWFK